MGTTTNWNLTKPVEGALGWHVPLNNNFDYIDSILQSIRTNFKESQSSTGPETHNEVGTLWYSVLENPGEGLFVKKSTGYTQLVDEAFADEKYIKANGDTFKGTLTVGENGQIYFYNALTFDFAKMLFQTYGGHQSLTFEFGVDETNSIRFVSNTGTVQDIFHIYTDKVKSFKPIEVPDATEDTHAINKGQADILYATHETLNDALLNHNLQGVPVAPTAPVGDNSTQIANTAFVTKAIEDGADNYMMDRDGISAANQDTATSNGFYRQGDNGSTSGLLVFNTTGSLGTLQQRFTYTGDMYFRNKTDNATWTPWKTVYHSGNFAASTLSNTASDIKMNGTQAAGTSSKAAKADHVHPVDTSRAAAAHNHDAANLTAGYLNIGRLDQNIVYPVHSLIPANAKLRTNLGTPTVGEIAMFPSEVSNKIQFIEPQYVTAEYTTDNITWTPWALSDLQKRKMTSGRPSLGTITIPNSGWTKVRFTFEAWQYSYLNYLYMYASTSGHTWSWTIQKSFNGTVWEDHVADSGIGSGWPSHQFISHASIPWRNDPTQGTHYKFVRVVLNINWNVTYPANGIQIYNIDWWGGYPAGRRELFDWDETRKIFFPSAIHSYAGVTATGGLGINGKSVQAAYMVAPDATDLASALTLINQLRTALINNGICA